MTLFVLLSDTQPKDDVLSTETFIYRLYSMRCVIRSCSNMWHCAGLMCTLQVKHLKLHDRNPILIHSLKAIPKVLPLRQFGQLCACALHYFAVDSTRPFSARSIQYFTNDVSSPTHHKGLLPTAVDTGVVSTQRRLS
jgi:hypothetical protein